MKKFFCGLAVGLILATSVPAVAENITIKPVNIKVNGTLINGGGLTFDGYTFVPFRKMGELLGMNVTWDAKTNTAILTSKTTGSLTVAQKYEKINNCLTLISIDTDLGYREKYEINNEGLTIWKSLTIEERKTYVKTKVNEIMNKTYTDGIYTFLVYTQDNNFAFSGGWSEALGYGSEVE